MAVQSLQQAVIYGRVSTLTNQSTEMQVRDLRQLADRRGFEVLHEYLDEGFSGAKSSRPALDEMLADAKQGKFCILLVWKLDRLGRSLAHLVRLLEDLRACNVELVSFSEGLDFDTWSLASSLSSALPAATPFRFNITCTGAAALAACKPSGGMVTYTLPSNGFTNETISITAPTGGPLNSVLNKTLTVAWTAPTTFTVAQSNLDAFIFNGLPGDPATISCDIQGVATTNNAVTSGAITIPNMLSCTFVGNPILTIKYMLLRVQIIGSNGENTEADLWF